MSSLPFVTVGIPCLNEVDFIEGVVASVLQQSYPADRFELIIADGGSTDGTLAKLERLARDDERVVVIHNPGRIQAAGMNEIIRRAQGDVLVRMDAHADYASDYLTRCVAVLEETGADNVGGAARSLAKNWFQKALCAALRSPLGAGGSRYRDAANEGFVESVFNGAFRRSVFETVGLYDPGAITNEDAELNQRIVQSGGRIYLSPDIVAFYYPRAGYRPLARQYFKYGKGRARTLLKHRRLPSVRPLIPFMLVSGGVLMVLLRPPFSGAALLAYLVGGGIEAVRVGRDAGWWAVPVVWSIFPVLHVSHGLGLAKGLWQYVQNPDWGETERIAARDVTG